MTHRVVSSSALLIFSLTLANLQGAGLDRNGIGAASMGVAGASVAWPADALAKMTQNPAGLSKMSKAEFQLGATVAYAEGDFSQGGHRLGGLAGTWGVLPEFAFTKPLNESVGIGFSLTTDTTRLAKWEYDDTPGALAGAQYSRRSHRSEILNMRAALGIGAELGHGFSVGASIGGVYNHNELRTPYIFQNNALAGAKTYLDLETDGFGMNGDLAVQWKATDRLAFGLSYRTPTSIHTSGRAEGDVGSQLKALGVNANGKYRYDADIGTNLPQKVTGGFHASMTDRWRVMGQVDWTNWSAAYDKLDVRLSNGSNPVVNGLTGSTGLKDSIPLDWQDRFSFRLGTEFDLTDAFVLRFGYAYGESPVPSSTLLPMTAAISEHTLTCGLGWHVENMSIDLAYQYDLPVSRSASGSSITGPEYKDSEVSLEAHWVGLTFGFKL